MIVNFLEFLMNLIDQIVFVQKGSLQEHRLIIAF